MKKHALSKRIISILLALVMAANTPMVIWADTMTIDSSGFTDPTITKGTVYYWHKGAPPATVDGTSYPVIMVWDDQYYLAADNNFYSEVIGPNKTRYALDCVSPRIDSVGDMQDVRFGDAKSSLLSGFYHKNREYASHSVSELPFDFNVLKKTGNAVSFGAPNLPRFVAVDVPQYGFGNQLFNNDTEVLMNAESERAYAIWFPNPNTGSTMDAKKYWLTATHRVYSYYDELDDTFGTKARYVNSLDWFLDVKVATQANFTNPEISYTPSHNGLNSRGHEAHPPKIDLKSRVWRVTEIDNSNQYHIYTYGGYDAFLKSFYADEQRNYLKSYVTNMDSVSAPLALMHTDSKLMSVGDRGGPEIVGWAAGLNALVIGAIGMLSPAALVTYMLTHSLKVYTQDIRYEDQKDFLGAKAGFDLYWGEPSTISFCQHNFTVQKGQVQTFDGPIAVGHDVTITVEDGGVLSCSDWILNNGTIVVKPGGTLLLQSYETANEQTRYGTIASLHEASGDDGGRIYCDGTLIVMPDCKLCCSGKYGLTLGEGAQVVNYGAIISENLSAAQSYTIENRAASSYVFAGWGLTDCGSTLLTERITSTSYAEKGVREKIAVVNLPVDAVYGKYSANLIVNAAKTVNRTNSVISGGVTDKVEPLPPLPNDPAGGSVVHSFSLSDGYPYTVYYPDNGELYSSMRDTEVSFMLYGDKTKQSYMCYEYSSSSGWVTQKYVLDVTRPVEVYKGYFRPEHSVLQEKLVFKGYLSDWDGSDMNYFAPPETDEEPILEVMLNQGYEIQLEGYVSAAQTPDKVINIGKRGIVMLYEKHDAVLLRYMSYVKDYTELHTVPADMNVKVLYNWIDMETMTLHRGIEYEGPIKDWVPVYTMSE